MVYPATDIAGNMATVIRVIDGVDTTPSVIPLLGDNPLNAENGKPYVDPGATAIDSAEVSSTGHS